jgi:hypothetical protein
VLFDRICKDNGIKHLLTAPRSPTTTRKIERFHKTLRREFLNDRTFTSIDDAQAQLDAWVQTYNHEPPSEPRLGRSVGPLPARQARSCATPRGGRSRRRRAGGDPACRSQRVDQLCRRPLPRQGVARRRERDRHLRRWARAPRAPPRARRDPCAPTPIAKQAAGLRHNLRIPKLARATATAESVTRKVDSSGSVCFAGAGYRVGSSPPARSRSRSSVRPSRSRSAPSSSARTRYATTAPANTAHSPIFNTPARSNRS